MMRAFPRCLIAGAMLGFLGTSSFSATINFDDVNTSSGDVLLSSYKSYEWDNISAYTTSPGFPGYNNGIVSSPNAAYTAGDASGSPVISSISSANPFNFVSAYFGSGWYDGLLVTVEGFFQGTQDFRKTFDVSTTGPQLVVFNFTKIDELSIFSTTTAATTDPYGCGSSGCSQVTIDNLTLTPASAPPTLTPEPSVLLLTSLGLPFFTALRRIRIFRLPR